MPTDLRAALSQSFGTRFRVERELGRGGMATVYLVHDAKHGRDVALKVLHPELAASLGRDRFLREIAFAARLTHPNILPLYESGEAGDALFYLMPYAEGDTLRTRLADQSALPVAEALRIARDVARALAYAHAHNVLHRDIKPGNILLESGSAVVADFGIARAVSRAADDVTLTDSGLLIGTPAYMAPELAGGREPDGRADIYALGCVLYQMLAGDPPFTGSSARAILARHALDTIPPLETVRPGLPSEVAAVVTRALQKVPADRYATAEAMADALDDLLAATTASRISVAVREPQRQRRGLPLAFGLTAAAGAAIWLGSAALTRAERNRASRPVLDTTRYAVLPIENAISAGNGNDLDQSMRDAVARWEGISVPDLPEVREAVARHAERGVSMASGRAAALSLTAGRYLRSDLSRGSDGSLRIHGALYATSDNVLLADTTAAIGPDLSRADSTFALLAERLLLRRPATPVRPGGDRGSYSLPARQAFIRGMSAIQRWDLPAADSQFATAIAADPQYAAADLWLAVVRSWSGGPVAAWRPAARRAMSGATALAARDQAVAAVVLARAEGDYVAACAGWKRMAIDHPNDFVAWYGSADCQHADSVVVRDPRSPSGWRFRTSYQSALDAYQRAFGLLPSTLNGLRRGSFHDLRELFGTSGSELRAGFAAYPDTSRFAAYSAWRGDTLAFVPAAFHDVMELRPGASPSRSSHSAAVQQQRALFLDVARAWAAVDPRNSAAVEAVAVALDLLRDRTALDTLTRARSVATTPGQRTHLAIVEVFMRLKRALPADTVELRSTRRLADSILAGAGAAAPDAATLMNLAALTGRAELLGRLARLRGANADWRVLRPLDGLALPLLMYSALGGPLDSLSHLERAVERAIAADVPADDQEAERLAWLGRSATLAYPVHRSGAIMTLSGRGDPLVDAMAADARGDRTAALRILSAAGRAHERIDPAEVSLEGLLPEAWLLARLGRAADAITRVDPTLQSIARVPMDIMEDPVATAALVRAMVLRAQLADAMGDRKGAHDWSTAVRILWSAADPFLQPVVGQMRQLSR